MRALGLVVACVLVACSGESNDADSERPGDDGELELLGTWCRPPDDEYDCEHCMTFARDRRFEMRSICPGGPDYVEAGTYDADARAFIADVEPCAGGNALPLRGVYTIANDVLTFDTVVSDIVIAGSSLERVRLREVAACE